MSVIDCFFSLNFLSLFFRCDILVLRKDYDFLICILDRLSFNLHFGFLNLLCLVYSYVSCYGNCLLFGYSVCFACAFYGYAVALSNLFFPLLKQFVIHNEELLGKEHYDKVSRRIYHNGNGYCPTLRVAGNVRYPPFVCHKSVLYGSFYCSRTYPEYDTENKVHCYTESEVCSSFEQYFSVQNKVDEFAYKYCNHRDNKRTYFLRKTEQIESAFIEVFYKTESETYLFDNHLNDKTCHTQKNKQYKLNKILESVLFLRL